MKKKILLTGITGFIGRYTARKIIDQYEITAIVRPGTDEKKYIEFKNKINIVFFDLSDEMALTSYLEKNIFDIILHIAALRAGRKFSKSEFVSVNVKATEFLIKSAIKNNSKFIFCSSVGVYGTIPLKLPADLSTPYHDDNLYHRTKILCEEMILKAVTDNKLNACIVRPAITYGDGDYGFTHTLKKLVKNRCLLLPHKKIYIHLLNVNTAAEVFYRLLEYDYPYGKIWNLADKEKVCFQELACFLSDKQKLSIRYKTPDFVFKFILKIAKLLRNELWISRIELISNSWYFEVDDVYNEFAIKSYKTIPDIR